MKYNKINSLINECLKEGIEVEISIPKKAIKFITNRKIKADLN